MRAFLMTFLVFAFFPIGDVDARPCTWVVSGKLTNQAGQPLKDIRLKFDARWASPPSPWNDPNWPDKTTNSKGSFSIKSKNLNPGCKKKRDIRIRMKMGSKWIKIAQKRTKKKKVAFGNVKVNLQSVARQAGCRIIKLDAPLAVGTNPLGRGVPFKASLKKITKGQLRKWDFAADISGKTTSGGKARGSLLDCSSAARKGKASKIYIAYHLEFHAASKQVSTKATRFASKVSFPKITTIPQRPAPTVRFRFPIENSRNIHKPGGVGPHGVDHGPWISGRETHDKDANAKCANYRGQLNFPHCYKGHKGTDYMLKGGFGKMDAKNWVVAGANGHIKRYSEGYYDKCHPALFDGPQPGKPKTRDCGKRSDSGVNYIHIDHGNGVVTKYLHLKKGSVAKALERLGMPKSKIKIRKKNGVKLRGSARIAVKCGQRIGQIGSSGYSAAPHLHFAVVHNGEPVDPYRGALSAHSYWVNQNRANQLPGNRCQK